MSKPFRHIDVCLSEEDFEETMRGLIDKSLAERITIGNVEYFRLTSIGEVVCMHMDTNPATRN